MNLKLNLNGSKTCGVVQSNGPKFPRVPNRCRKRRRRRARPNWVTTINYNDRRSRQAKLRASPAI